MEDNLLNIEFKHEQYGAISCKGEILPFNHNDKESYLSFKIKEKEIKGKSFSKKGYPFDNAYCESFFKHLKKNKVNRKKYHSAEDLYLDLFDYIENLND